MSVYVGLVIWQYTIVVISIHRMLYSFSLYLVGVESVSCLPLTGVIHRCQVLTLCTK